MTRFRLLSLAALSLLALPALRAGEFPEPYDTEPDDPDPPMTAAEAAKTATLPEGFRLTVFASEPEVRQPIAMCFDDRGRLWVAECYTYAERPLRWDLELRDRVLVFEDSDDDGKPDKRTIFWDEGTRLTSVAHGRGGAWVLCAPQLLFLPDADGDAVPDGDPVVVLDGFDAETIGHNVVNGLKWGPDGWLYGRHGITATSLVGKPGTPEADRVALNCSIWRYHPERETFEVFCHGGTNPWGLDWNADGQLFYTNTVIGHFWHAIPGAYYERMFGAHLNPHAYEIIPHTADHYHWDTGSEKWSDIREGITGKTSELGGGHAHMGCLIYGGGTWPEMFHGKVFTCNLHGRRVNMDHLEREGNGYVARHGKDFLMMEDPWFRGLDLVTGPKGQVWLNDWSDTGECHDNTGIHRNSGRIYRIVYDGPDAGEPTPDRPGWLTKRAEGPLSGESLDDLLNSDDEAKRAMAARWLAEDAGDDPAATRRLVELAKSDSSGLVRLEIAAALQRLPSELRISLAYALCDHEEDAEDRQQSLMIWYGVAEVAPEYPGMAIELASASRLPTVRRLIARRLGEELEKSPEAVDLLLSRAASELTPDRRSDILAGMNEALRGWSRADAPKSWDAFSAKIRDEGSDSDRETLRGLALLFGDGRARDELLAIAKDAEADAGARRNALASLLRDPTDDLLPLLKEWVNDRILGEAAVRGIARYDEPGVSVRLLNRWKRYGTGRDAVIDVLVSRASFASDLLDAVEKGDLPRDAISPFQARQIQSLGDEKLASRLQETWGQVRETPAGKKAELEKWTKLLTPATVASADPVKGREIFLQSCSACHILYGEGGKLGPDLTGSDRHNIAYLLDNILDPNAVVPADYQMTVFTLADGRVVSGVIPEENERSITVQTPVELVVLDRDQVEKRDSLPVSLMPEGLFTALGEDAVRDLVAYLVTKNPPAPEKP